MKDATDAGVVLRMMWTGTTNGASAPAQPHQFQGLGKVGNSGSLALVEKLLLECDNAFLWY